MRSGRLSHARPSQGESPQAQKGAAENSIHRARIRIVGLGGGGGSVVAEIAQRVSKVDCVIANTDIQALKGVPSNIKTVSFGQEFTRGLGCGMDVAIGEKAARAEKEKIKKIFEGQDVCIFIAALGGGTGSGAAPVFAQIASEEKCLTLGIFLLPFRFEGEKRQQVAKAALDLVIPWVNAYLVIPNENIFSTIDQKTHLKEAFSMVNSALADAIQGLIETIYSPGLINIDFADLKSLLEGRSRLAYIHSAVASGPAKAQEAVKSVLSHSLLEYGVEGTERILFNIVSDRNMKMQEVVEISNAICAANPKAKIIFGIAHDPKLKDRVRVSLCTVGCKTKEQLRSDPSSEKTAPLQNSPKKESKKSFSGKGRHSSSKKIDTLKEQERKETTAFLPAKGSQEFTGAKQTAAGVVPSSRQFKQRRNGLELKKDVDKAIEEFEEKQKEWDIPAFLRNKSIS